jgi:DNA-binding response OmpR family regulator
MKVLAVEDQPLAATQLLATLRWLGHEGELVTDGGAAWTRLRESDDRVVVCDWRLPTLDGLELCRRIRSRGGEYVYFILISTIKITKASRDLALAAGVDDFLQKPIDPEELGMRLHVADRIGRYVAQVRRLESFLPICSCCKKVRNDQQYWQEIETYYTERQGTVFSHGFCPDCLARERARLEKL